MKNALVIAVLLFTLPGPALASDKPLEVVCVLKDEAVARINLFIDGYQRLSGKILSVEERADMLSDAQSMLPSYLRVVETKADCPKGTRIYRTSTDPNIRPHYEDNK